MNTNVHLHTQALTNYSIPSQTHTNPHNHSHTFINAHKPSQSLAYPHKHTQTLTNTHKPSQTHTNPHKHSQTLAYPCTNTPVHTPVYHQHSNTSTKVNSLLLYIHIATVFSALPKTNNIHPQAESITDWQ